LIGTCKQGGMLAASPPCIECLCPETDRIAFVKRIKARGFVKQKAMMQLLAAS
jgi:hypothetical protein